MSVATLTRILLVVVLAAFAQSGFAADGKRPNILFIYADDQSYKTVSCYPEAQKWVKTPNIDALAATGVRFERSYLGAWCMPSRASMLTGRLQHGVESMRMEGEYPGCVYDPKQTPFFPAVMRAQGYHTAQIGKWHTGIDSGFGRDWDHQIVWNRPKYPANAGNYYDQQQLERDGVVLPELQKGYSTDNYTKWAIEYLKQRQKEPGKPWYLWLCYGGIHGPTTPAERHKGTYSGNVAKLPADVFGPRLDKPKYLDEVQAWVPGANGEPMLKKGRDAHGGFDQRTEGLTLQAWIQQMNECARAVDDGVGQLMEALRATGQLENTLVVYSADQGYAMGEHGINAKLAPYDGSISSPLIVSYPGVTKVGAVCSQPVNSPDLVATFLSATGVQVPWKLHGHDLTPQLRDPSQAINRPMILTHTGRSYGSDANDLDIKKTNLNGYPWYVLLREAQFKYVRYLIPNEIEELYDLANDPEELVNLAVKPAHKERLERMRTVAIAELKRTEAGFAEHLPPVATR